MIRLVWGTGEGATAKASFDAALATAGIHQYNLRKLSSVIPAPVQIDEVGTAPDLGPTGHALDVVIARQTSPPGTRAVAGLAWLRGADGAGIFYEEAAHDEATVREQLRAGIEHGGSLREIDGTTHTRVVSAEPAAEADTTALVAAIYGDAEQLC